MQSVVAPTDVRCTDRELHLVLGKGILREEPAIAKELSRFMVCEYRSHLLACTVKPVCLTVTVV